MSEKDCFFRNCMILAQTGDQVAYQELLDKLSVYIKRFVIKIGVESMAADDVVQNSLIAIHQARHTYLPERSFLNWAFGIVRKKCFDYFRQVKRKKTNEMSDDVFLETIMASVESFEDQHEKKAKYSQVMAALEQLPPKQQAIVRGLKLEDKSVRDMAERLKMSESAVKISAHRGYKAIKDWLRRSS